MPARRIPQLAQPDRLPRGRSGLSREQVAAHQRARLMQAMVELVGERGLAATTVADLIAGAGVSRRAFYEQFADKADCFLATYDIVAARAHDAVAEAYAAARHPEEQLALGLGALTELALAHPSAHRLLLVEVAGAGQQGIARRERMISDFEGVLGERIGLPPRHGPVADPLLRAVVGGLLRIFDARAPASALRRASADIPAYARWALSYYPTPEALDELAASREHAPQPIGGRAPGTLAPTSISERSRRAGTRAPTLSRSLGVHSQRERILDAVAQLSAEKGYAATSLLDIAERAALSLEAFYEHFEDKEDAFLVAYEIGHGKCRALVERAHESASEWPQAVRDATLTLLSFLAAEPAFAHLALVDALIAAPRTAERAQIGVRRYAELLVPGFALAPSPDDPPQIALEAIAGGVFELCLAYTLRGEATRLTELAPIAVYFALAPFTGRERAAALARDALAA